MRLRNEKIKFKIPIGCRNTDNKPESVSGHLVGSSIKNVALKRQTYEKISGFVLNGSRHIQTMILLHLNDQRKG